MVPIRAISQFFGQTVNEGVIPFRKGENKGLGLIATQTYAIGEIVIESTPLWSDDSPWNLVLSILSGNEEDRLVFEETGFEKISETVTLWNEGDEIIQNKLSIQFSLSKERVHNLYLIVCSVNTRSTEGNFCISRKLSYCNHSCNPNTVVVTLHGSDKLVAKNAIAINDEITISYIPSPPFTIENESSIWGPIGATVLLPIDVITIGESYSHTQILNALSEALKSSFGFVCNCSQHQ